MRIKLKALRMGRKLTQGQVAKVLDCTTATYARIENADADISYEKLYVLASIYGLKVYELFKEVDRPADDLKSRMEVQAEKIQLLKKQVIEVQNKAIQLHQELHGR